MNRIIRTNGHETAASSYSTILFFNRRRRNNKENAGQKYSERDVHTIIEYIDMPLDRLTRR